MYKSRKRLVVLCIGILVVLGMWMMLSVHCWAAETDNDKEQLQMAKQDNSTQQETKKSDTQIKEKKIIRVGSFEDTFDYVDANGMRRGYGYELMQALAGYTGCNCDCS